MVREIIKDKEILRKKSETVTKSEVADIVKDLIDTAKANPTAVGLAAVQIGIHRNIFIAKMRNEQWRAFINPKIVAHSKEKIECDESCLSVEGSFKKTRYRSVDIIYFDMQNKTRKNTFIGFEAQIIQHEMEHLNGIYLGSENDA